MREPRPSSLCDVIDHLDEQTREEEEVGVSVLLDSFGERAFGPLLLVPALLVLTPLGAIPGVPTFAALLVLLVAVQRLFGRRSPWIPRALRDREIDRERVTRALDRARPWARRIDRVAQRRWPLLVEGPMRAGVAAMTVALALSMPPLEIVPMAAALPAAGIGLFGIATTTNDGLVAVLAWAASAGAVWLVIRFVA